MTAIRCHDCGVLEKNDKSVSIRQCDWLLCDKCEKARKSGAIKKKPSSDKESNRLKKHVQSPQNRPQTHIPPPSLKKQQRSLLYKSYYPPLRNF